MGAFRGEYWVKKAARVSLIAVLALFVWFKPELRASPGDGKPPNSPAQKFQFPAPASAPDSVDLSTRPVAGKFNPPIFFERNQGQSDPSVLYISRGLGYSLFFTRSGVTVVLPGSVFPISAKAPTKNGRAAANSDANYFTLSFEGSNPDAIPIAEDQFPGKSDYFTGPDPSLWHRGISQYAKVRYANLYPGIDVLFYVRDGRLEYDLIAAPGADLRAIHIREKGSKPRLTAQGDVVLRFGKQEFRLQKPRVYQGDLQTHLIATKYSLSGDDLAFQVGQYDRAQPITIDPALIFSSYLTTNCTAAAACADSVADIAADQTGVYITGSTTASTFPATSGSSPAIARSYPQTFVIKLNPSGTSIIYAAFLTSSSGFAVSVDTQGSAYVAGQAIVGYPNNPVFPLTPGVFSGVVPANTYGYVAYAAKLSPDGSTIDYSTLLQQPRSSGGNNVQVVLPSKIVADSTGAVYVTGSAQLAGVPGGAYASWSSVPVTSGAFQTTPGSLFALKLTPTGSGLTYSTYLDGSVPASADTIGSGVANSGIAIDTNGNAFITGTAGAGFPTTSGAYQTTAPTAIDSAFVTELNPTGTAQVYSTYFTTTAQPDSENVISDGIAVDPSDEAVIVGRGNSPPVTLNGFCGIPTAPPASTSGFIAKFNPTGTALVYSTTVCGHFDEVGGVALDATGAAYATGVTSSPANFQPNLLNPIQGYITLVNGVPPPQQIALKLNTSGTLQWSTFLGAAGGTSSQSRIALDATDDAYILYGSSSFPATPNAVGIPGFANGGNNLVIKIAPSLGAPVPLASPGSVTFSAQNVGTASASIDVQVGDFGDAPMAPVVSITGDFSETDDCATSVAGGAKCDINVVFRPTASGTRTGLLSVSFGGSISLQTVSLTGTGTAPAVTLAPVALSFGVQAVGTTSAAQQVTLTNSGTGALSVTSVQASAQFASTNSCGGPIAPGNNCTIQVTFTPSASGIQTGTLTIIDSASNSPQTVSLSGNQPANFSISAGGGSSSTSANVAPGQTATYSLSIAGTNGFSGPVSFACTGAPANSTCSVSPNPATVSGTTLTSVTVSIVTQAASGLPIKHFRGPQFRGNGTYLLALALASIVLMYLALTKSDGRFRRGYLGLACMLLLGICVGCGGSSNSSTQTATPATPAGQYTITVTGTSGPINQSMSLTLTVS